VLLRHCPILCLRIPPFRCPSCMVPVFRNRDRPGQVLRSFPRHGCMRCETPSFFPAKANIRFVPPIIGASCLLSPLLVFFQAPPAASQFDSRRFLPAPFPSFTSSPSCDVARVHLPFPNSTALHSFAALVIFYSFYPQNDGDGFLLIRVRVLRWLFSGGSLR